MGRIIKLFSKKDTLRIFRSKSGDWMVKRNYSILYVGSREKCEMYLAHLKAA